MAWASLQVVPRQKLHQLGSLKGEVKEFLQTKLEKAVKKIKIDRERVVITPMMSRIWLKSKLLVVIR